MDPNLSFALLFGAGILLESVLLIAHEIEAKDVLKILVIMLGSAIYVGFQSLYNHEVLSNATLAFLYTFAIFFALTFQKKILPLIDETVILIWTILLWYVYLNNLGGITIYNNFTYFFAAVSLIIVIINILPLKLSGFVRVALYIYYLLIVLLIFLDFTFDIFFKNRPIVEAADNLTIIFLGMMVMSVFSIYSSLTLLLPNKSGRKNEQYSLLAKKFAKKQAHPIMTIATLVIIPALLYFNNSYHLISMWGIISVIAVASPFIVQRDYYFKKH